MKKRLQMSTKESESVWDKDVPIISNKFTTDIYLSDQIGEPYLYDELCYTLGNTVKSEISKIHINTPGGIVDSAFKIADGIKHAKAKVVAYLTGTIASAGTIITMACDDIVVADHTSFMIHNYSGAIQGKGNEIKAHQNYLDANLNAAFKAIYAGFLTEQEMKEVIDGRDIWMGKDEILERWGNRKNFIEKSYETIED